MKSLTYKDQPDSPSSESTPDESTAPRPSKAPIRDSDRTGETPNRRDDDDLVADEDADDDEQFEDDDEDGDDADADGDATPSAETDEA